jgi:hypothetical protein
MEKYLRAKLGNRPFAEESDPPSFSIARRTCRYGMVMRYAQTNASAGIEDVLKPIPQVKHRPGIVDPAEPDVLLRAIDGYLGEISTRCVLKILPNVSLRSSELRGAQ